MADEASRAVPFAERTLPAILQAQASLGNRPFIRTAKHVLSYAQAPTLAARIAYRAQVRGRSARRTCRNILRKQARTVAAMARNSVGGRRARATEHGSSRAATAPRPTGHPPRQPLYRNGTSRTVARGSAALFPPFGTSGCSTVRNTHGRDRIGPSLLERWTLGNERAAPEAIGPGDASAISSRPARAGPRRAWICPRAQCYWWGVHTGKALGVGTDNVLYTTLPFFHTKRPQHHVAGTARRCYLLVWCALFGQRLLRRKSGIRRPP